MSVACSTTLKLTGPLVERARLWTAVAARPGALAFAERLALCMATDAPFEDRPTPAWWMRVHNHERTVFDLATDDAPPWPWLRRVIGAFGELDIEVFVDCPRGGYWGYAAATGGGIYSQETRTVDNDDPVLPPLDEPGELPTWAEAELIGRTTLLEDDDIEV